MNEVHHFLLKTKPYRLFIEWTKTIMLPGFSPLPLYTVAAFFIKEIAKDSLVNKASSLAYNFMLAIFPGIIFLFTLIPYIPIPHFQDQLLSLIELVLPQNAFLAFESTLKDIIKNQNGKLLSIGFIMALFFATNGITTLMQAFNKSSLLLESRSWFRRRWVAFKLTWLLAGALFLGLLIITVSEFVVNHIKNELTFEASFWIRIISLFRLFILVIIYFFTISIIYRYGPANAKKWHFFSPGSWLATLLAMLTFWGFSFYINNFGTYNKIYGSIGTLLVIMIWLYLNSLIILIGFELNASIELSKRNLLRLHTGHKSLKNDSNKP